MNYKLTAITFKTINEAISFIAQQNHKWVEVDGKTHQIIRNKNTTVIITVVFAKAIVENLPVISEFLSNYLKVVKSKTKQHCLKLLFETFYPYPRIKNSDEMVNFKVPTTEKKVKEFLRDKVDDLAYKVPDNETDKEAWHTSLFMIKVSMETEGVKFWRAAARVIEWLNKQEQKYVPI
jgi:hypothetical protein